MPLALAHHQLPLALAHHQLPLALAHHQLPLALASGQVEEKEKGFSRIFFEKIISYWLEQSFVKQNLICGIMQCQMHWTERMSSKKTDEKFMELGFIWAEAKRKIDYFLYSAKAFIV